MGYKDIPINKIKVLENIRQENLGNEQSSLMESIKQNGLMQPIGVKKQKNNYTLIWGYRRLKAYKKLGYKTIPARIFMTEKDQLSEEEFIILNTTENIQRKNISQIELGRVVEFLRKKYNMTLGEVAVKLSAPLSRIKTVYELHRRVPEKHKKRIQMGKVGENRKGTIPLTVAQKITNIKGLNIHQREKVFDWVLKEDIPIGKITLLTQLHSQGVSLEDAIKKSNEYRTMNITLLLNRKKENKHMGDFNTLKKMIIQGLNKSYPDLILE